MRICGTKLIYHVVVFTGGGKMAVAIPKVEVKRRGRATAEQRRSGYRITVLQSDVAEKKFEVKTKSVEERHGSLEAALPYGSLYGLEEHVAMVLDGYGVIGTNRIQYLNFARKLWREISRYGWVKSSTVNAMIALWRSKGATERVLRDIVTLFEPYIVRREAAEGGGEVTL